LNSPLLSNILVAIVLGLGTGIVLRLLRNLGPGRHMRFWLLLAALAAGSYLIVNTILHSPGSLGMEIFLAATILLSANAALQLFNLLIWDYALKQRRGISIPRLVVDVIDFVVLAAVALALLKTVFAVNLNAFLVTSTVVSAVVGLSLQDVLGSVVAGMALQMERPFSVGDWVQIGDVEGQVLQMNWRTLTIRTRENNAVILPNSNVSKQTIVNYSRLTPFMLKVGIGLEYEYPPGDVKAALMCAMRECGAALDEPPPSVMLISFDDSSILYEARFWANDFGKKPASLDAVRTRIWYTLKRNGMEVPFPQMDVTLHTVPEDFEEKQTEKLRNEIFAGLRSLPLFVGLSDGQIGTISRTSSLQRFTSDEELVRQGDTGDSMYVIKSGGVRVMVSAGGGEGKLVARLGPGEYFGEMSLLTGEPRSASVIAETETEVLALTKADFSSIVSSDAAVVEELSKALSDRMQLLSEKAAESAAHGKQSQAPQRADLIRRIRGFFGI
jgi:small-conductance mechanosensitive channel/CRP-like cAMP-binding protein